MKTDEEIKRIYNLVNATAPAQSRKKEKALNLLSYEIVNYLATNGVKIRNINNVLTHALEIPLEAKAIHINKHFKIMAKQRGANKCAICGATENLSIHHIKQVTDYPELKYNYENTIICCTSCHEYIHNWEAKLNPLKEAAK